MRRTIRRLLTDRGWYMLGAIGLLAVGLGTFGFCKEESLSDAFYQSLQLFALEFPDDAPTPTPLSLQVARLLAAVFVAGAVVRLLLRLFRDLDRAVRVWLMRDHVVICGLGERGALLAGEFLGDERRRDVVAIEPDEGASGVEECREAGAVVIVGDGTDEQVLRKAGIAKARYLVAVGGDDGLNAEVAANAAKLVTGRRVVPLEAYVHIVDPALANLLGERERASRRRESCRMRFFNVYAAGARAWIARYPPFGPPEAAPVPSPHLAVVGVGQLGTSLILGAARSWLARFSETTERPRITLVDREAGRKREWLMAEFPDFERYCDLIPRVLDVTSPHFRQASFLLDSEGRPDVTSVYVCMDDDGRSLTAALTLHDRLQEAARLHGRAPTVVVRLRRYAGLAKLIGDDAEGPGSLRAFTLLDRTCTLGFLLGRSAEERLARQLHEVYLRMAAASAGDGDVNPSAVPWDDLPEQLRESNRRQAEHARVKLRSLGYTYAPAGADSAPPVELSEEQIQRLARMEHDRFVAERRFEGWSEGERDPLAKESPYLVGWDALPEKIQAIDVAFVRALPDALRDAGLQIVPLSDADD